MFDWLRNLFLRGSTSRGPQSPEMPRDEAFAELKRRGVSLAVLKFSGGNDEGFVDEVALFNARNEQIGALEEESDNREDRLLVEALSWPMVERYGTFAGEFSTEGTITYHVDEMKAVMEVHEVPDTSRPSKKIDELYDV